MKKISIGNTPDGVPVAVDIAQIGQLLVGGCTGQGKSMFLHSLICSLAAIHSPDEVRFVLMDPKGVEFGAYAKLPHLYSPVVNKPEQCMTMLRYVEAEVERRLAMFGEKDVRDISDFRKYLIVVVDEFSDYILELDDEFVSILSRISAMGGSVGVYLVLSTSRIDAINISSAIKANIPSRLAFRVCRNVDSLTLLDEGGAEDLLMCGDALFKDGDSDAIRLQVPYVRDETVKQIVDSAIAQYPGREFIIGHSFVTLKNEDLESMYSRALDLVRTTRRASTSWFQRQLNIGYNDALKVISLLEERGIIGPPEQQRGTRSLD